MRGSYALTPKGRALALTLRLRVLFETLSEAEQNRVLAELERLVTTYRKTRVPLRSRARA